MAWRSGLLRPRRPDRLLRGAVALHRYGPTLAGECASAAAIHGDAVAMIDDERAVSYRALDGRSNALAHALRVRGVAAGQSVAILARDHIGFAEATIAASKLGAHAVLLNPSMAGPQLVDVCAREGVTMLVHDGEFADRLARIADTVPRVRTEDFEAMISSRVTAPLPPPPAPGRIVILTSGTTGTPKGARRSAAPPIAAAIGTLDAIPYRGGEPIVVAAPLFHSWGFAHLSIGLGLGSPIVVTRRFDPQTTLAAIARHRATTLVAVPVMLRRLLELSPTDRARYDTRSLRLVPLSGSAIPAGLAEAFMNVFGEVIYNLYGSTEVGSATVANPADLRAAPGTAGRAPGGVDVAIFDALGNRLAAGRRGRIAVRSGLLFEGYTSGDSKQVVDGFMFSGDTGRLDDEGRLFVDGRDDEMIVSGGENVYPREVEDLLTARDDVVECAVIGVDDPDFGQRLKAYVVRVADSTLDAETVRAYVRAHLARYKVPRDVEFVGTLPRNPTGKVLKRDLQ